MNGYELAGLTLAEILLFLYLWRAYRSLRLALLISVLIAAPLWISIERATAFMTADEAGFLPEAMDPLAKELPGWNWGALRTTDVLNLGLARLIGVFFQPDWIPASQIAKSFHWLLGILGLFQIARIVASGFVAERRRPVGFLLVAYVGLLFPVNVLALKLFNYDLLSLLLGVLAILYLSLALRASDRRAGLLAVALATLAAQEKLSASPILIVSLTFYGYLSVRDRVGRRALPLIGHLAVAFGVAAAISAASTVAVAALHDWNWSLLRAERTLDPLVMWVRPFLWPTPLHQPFVERRELFTPLALVICAAGGLVLLALDRLVAGRQERIGALIYRSRNLLLLGSLAGGVAGTYLVRAYWAPARPIPPGGYQPSAWFNGFATHFEAPNVFAHTALSVVWSYTVFVNALPTVFWIVALGLIIYRWRRPAALKDSPYFDVVAIACLAVPFFFGVFQMPVVNRYFNVMLFALVLAILIPSLALLDRLPGRAATALAGAAGLVLLAEVLPFRPLMAPFRPIWADYGAAYNTVADEPGRLNPWWTGWGEELGLLGPAIRRDCEARGAGACDRATIGVVVNDLGVRWLEEGQPIEVIEYQRDLPETVYTADTYFVVNRLCFVTQAQCGEFPAGVWPEATLDFRGYVQAWVFRGDRLKEAGFHWKWPGGTAGAHGVGAEVAARAGALAGSGPLYLVAGGDDRAALHRLLADRVDLKVVDPSTVVFRSGEPALVLTTEPDSPAARYLADQATLLETVPFGEGTGAYRFYRLPADPPALAAGWQRLDASWDNGVRLLAARIEPRSGLDGPVRVGFLWQPGEASPRRYRFAVDLMGPLGRSSQTIEIGYPAGYWAAGETALTWFDLIPGPGTPAGSYQVRISMHTEPFVKRLTLHLNPPAEPPVDSLAIGQVALRDRGAEAPAAGPVLGGWLRLVGVEAPAEAAPGSTVPVRLTWRAEATPTIDYTMIVHLIDAQGRLAAQYDGLPLQGTLPTTAWLPGEAIVDVANLSLPGTIPPGSYTLIAGAYDVRTGERLMLPTGAGHVVVGRLEVR